MHEKDTKRLQKVIGKGVTEKTLQDASQELARRKLDPANAARRAAAEGYPKTKEYLLLAIDQHLYSDPKFPAETYLTYERSQAISDLRADRNYQTKSSERTVAKVGKSLRAAKKFRKSFE